MESMTPQKRVIDYICFCESAYGAPAPDDEVRFQLRERHGLDEAQSDEIIASLEADGCIAYHEGEFFDGWQALSPNN